jgi:hypothetical protein
VPARLRRMPGPASVMYLSPAERAAILSGALLSF